MIQPSNQNQQSKLSEQLIEKILQDPLLLRKICDRIYDLMQEELNLQSELTGNYRKNHYV
jgi:hypothetical protein